MLGVLNFTRSSEKSDVLNEMRIAIAGQRIQVTSRPRRLLLSHLLMLISACVKKKRIPADWLEKSIVYANGKNARYDIED